MHKTLIFFWLSEHQRKHYIHLSFFNFISLLLEHNQITCAQISVPIYSLDKLILVTGSQSQSADLTYKFHIKPQCDEHRLLIFYLQTLIPSSQSFKPIIQCLLLSFVTHVLATMNVFLCKFVQDEFDQDELKVW